MPCCARARSWSRPPTTCWRNWPPCSAGFRIPAPDEPDLDPEYARLLACIDWEPRGIDELSRAADLPVAAVASMLLRLELEGAIRSVPGGLYQRR